MLSMLAMVCLTLMNLAVAVYVHRQNRARATNDVQIAYLMGVNAEARWFAISTWGIVLPASEDLYVPEGLDEAFLAAHDPNRQNAENVVGQPASIKLAGEGQ